MVNRAANPLMKVPSFYVSFEDFEGSVAATCFDLIREPDDLTRIVMELATDAAADAVVYIEPAFGFGEIFAELTITCSFKTWANGPRYSDNLTSLEYLTAFDYSTN